MRASSVAASGSELSVVPLLVCSELGVGFRTVFGVLASSRVWLRGVFFWSSSRADFFASIFAFKLGFAILFMPF